jgi:hypothetical protein
VLELYWTQPIQREWKAFYNTKLDSDRAALRRSVTLKARYRQVSDINRSLIRTVKVRDRGLYVRGKDVHVEWTFPDTYKRLYQHNRSDSVPRTVEEITRRQRRPTQVSEDRPESDMALLNRVELEYFMEQEEQIETQLRRVRARLKLCRTRPG